MGKHEGSSFRTVRWIAFIAVAAVSLGGGAAIAAITQRGGAEPARWDENVQWQSAAQGTDGNFGRYEIFRAAAANRECFGISLPDQDPPGVARAIDAACIDDPTLEVTFIRGRAGTLAYGVARGDTESVSLAGPGHASRRGRVIGGPAGTKYFVVSDPDAVPKAQVTAVDGAGRTIAVRTAAE